MSKITNDGLTGSGLHSCTQRATVGVKGKLNNSLIVRDQQSQYAKRQLLCVCSLR